MHSVKYKFYASKLLSHIIIIIHMLADILQVTKINAKVSIPLKLY